jgi:hypothetical protein
VAEFKLVNKYALIVGINEYSGLNIPPLRFAVNDAEALYRVLTDSLRGAFHPESVVLLTDMTARMVRSIKLPSGC